MGRSLGEPHRDEPGNRDSLERNGHTLADQQLLAGRADREPGRDHERRLAVLGTHRYAQTVYDARPVQQPVVAALLGADVVLLQLEVRRRQQLALEVPRPCHGRVGTLGRGEALDLGGDLAEPPDDVRREVRAIEQRFREEAQELHEGDARVRLDRIGPLGREGGHPGREVPGELRPIGMGVRHDGLR
jgi:hypothetical protein